MSFILDALKKSENERARQNGPALLEARVLPPRRGVPVWAVVVGVILVANLALLAWVLLRTPSTPATVVAAAQPQIVFACRSLAAPAPTTPATPDRARDRATRAPPAPLPAPTIVAPPPAQAYAPPSTQTYSPPPPASAVVNPADYAPARPAGPAPRTFSPPPRSSGGYGLDQSLPTAADLIAGGSGMPALRLALHAYSDDPANRYVLINSQRLHEGEMTNEGARVEAIAPEGVLMSWRGQRFRLLPGE